MEESNIIIDFDDASNEWRSNKRFIGNGMFVYKCIHVKKNKKKCVLTDDGKIVLQNQILCKHHFIYPNNVCNNIFM